MPWKEKTVMSQRLEFVRMAAAPGANVRRLCRHFGISPTTAYKWIDRFRHHGVAGLADHSRRPLRSPARTEPRVERMVLDLRAQHPAWGGRKLHRRLKDLGQAEVPSPSTITDILHRHGLISAQASSKRGPFTRFEHAAPNDLWQMDFKGEFPTNQGLCYPLTVLDDHSRFSLGLRACENLRMSPTQAQLEGIFRCYGVPVAMTMDNGTPWGMYRHGRCHITALTMWLMRLGIRISHSRPYHPQTQGKDERFHRSLDEELLSRRSFRNLSECQRAFDEWREVYNGQRPHEALGLEVPASRYEPSWQAYPETLPEIVYPRTDQVRIVQKRGQIKHRQRRHFISNVLTGLPVGLRETDEDGVLAVYFCQQRITFLDLREEPAP